MILDRVEKGIQAFGVTCVGLLFILTTLQVILRYGFGYSSLYMEELGRYLLIWMALAGVAIEVRYNRHIRITFLAEQLPKRLRRFLYLVIELVVLLLFLILIYTGIKSTIFNHGQESAGIQIPLSFPFAAIPVFFIFSALFTGERLRKYRNPYR